MRKSAAPKISLMCLLLASAAAYGAGSIPDGVAKDVDQGYYRRALASLQALVKEHPQDAEVQFRYGEALLGVNQTDDALAAMKQAVALDPKNGIYHRGLGEVYGTEAQDASIFSALGLAKSSLAEFQAAAQLAPDDVDAHADLAAYYTQAPGIAGGDGDKAHAEEAVIAKLDPVRGLQQQAADARYDKDYDKAEALLKQAAAQDARADSYSQLGTLYMDRKRYAEALDAFTAAAAKSPADPAPWYWIGRASELGQLRYDDGIAALKTYIGIQDHPDSSPSFAWAHLRLADLYLLSGKGDLARTEFTAAQGAADGGDKELSRELRKVGGRLK
jgi:tetratricopeptide (TPR) repeat protein